MKYIPYNQLVPGKTVRDDRAGDKWIVDEKTPNGAILLNLVNGAVITAEEPYCSLNFTPAGLIKSRTVREELIPYMEKILGEKGIMYSLKNDGGTYRIASSLSSKQFHLFIERAMCAKQQEETGSKLPVMSMNMILNGEHKNGQKYGAYTILEKDRERYMKEIAQIQ